MKSLFLVLFIRLVPLQADPPIWINDLSVAMKKAREEKKFVLLNFSGSDWCIPCIRMHREIFSSDAFQLMASHKLILVNADFPRQKKNQPSKEQQRMNEVMAEKYDPEGKFPMTVLLDAEGHVIRAWEGYYEGGAAAFTHLLDNLTDLQ